MADIENRFQAQRRSCDYHPADQRIILAIRAAVLNLHHKRNPMPALIRILGSERAGLTLVRMLHVIGREWPEPIGIELPCRSRVSMDENLIIDMITATVQNDRGAFDHLLCEMLPQHPRDELFEAVRHFIDPFVSARADTASR